jgi:hypothetical protein
MLHDPNELRRRWSKILKCEELGLITREEVLAQLYDFFVHCWVRKDAHREWEAAALEVLPNTVASELLAYIKVSPPRLLAPRSSFPEVTAAELRGAPLAQKELMALLDKKSR